MVETLSDNIEYGTYKDGFLVFKDKKGYYIVQSNGSKEYKKYLKKWKKPKKILILKKSKTVNKSAKHKSKTMKGGSNISSNISFNEDRYVDPIQKGIKRSFYNTQNKTRINISALPSSQQNAAFKHWTTLYEKNEKLALSANGYGNGYK